MNKYITTAITLALFAAALTISAPSSHAAKAAPRGAALTKSDVLTLQNGKFYLHGRRYAEISFNKFDLFWQLFDLLKSGKGDTQEYRDMVDRQDQALRELHEMGFHGIRFFALPYLISDFRETYNDPQKRESVFYKALDAALDLCDKNQIRVVYDLGAANFTDASIVNGKWVYGQEQARELIANPDSRGRKELYRYIDDIVNRYKNRKAILLWEISNEVTLNADILPDAGNIYEGQRMPSLADVARFYDDVAHRIKANDPLRLVNGGGGHLRSCQWNQFVKHAWIVDTLDEQNKALDLLYAKSAVDIIDIHYGLDNKNICEMVKGANGKDIPMNTQRYQDAALRIGKPLMLGEAAVNLVARDDQPRNKKIYVETPDEIDSYWDPNAAKWVKALCDEIVDAGPQLTFWWTYSSDRTQDQRTPSFFIKKGRTDPVLKVIMETNKRLKSRLGAN